jgi:hypothetical protein
MDRKEEQIGLRLTGDELAKAKQVAALRGCSLSEAVRLMIRGTQVKTVAVIEISPSIDTALALA